MVRNLHGGNKHKKFKNKNPQTQVTRTTIRAEHNQLYAKVLKRMGNNKISVVCSDGQVRICSIPGKYRKKMWLNPDDILLIDLETHGSSKSNVCTMNHKYNCKDIDSLKQENMLGHMEVTDNENLVSSSSNSEDEPELYYNMLDDLPDDLSDSDTEESTQSYDSL